MERTEAIETWQKLGTLSPAELADARVQLHWAAQVPAAAAGHLLDPAPGDTHTSLTWVDGRLATQQFTDGRRVALELATLKLSILRPDGAVDEELSLSGAGLGDGMRWASERAAGGWALRLPEYDMPGHPVRSGGSFADGDLSAFEELSRWYGNGAGILGVLQAANPTASPVRCWPHHFDIATLVALDPEGTDPEAARSVGLGLSPGDATTPEPYLYVLPWPEPKPKESEFPALAHGAWHTEGFVAGMLRGPEIVESGAAQAQAELAVGFLESALSASREILESK
jgi:hypothetical protein